MKIQIHNKEYNVKEAKTSEELLQGLRGVTELPENEGMLFFLPSEDQEVSFTMTGMSIPLDIVFINLDQTVIDVATNCLPETKSIVNSTDNMDEDDYVAYVLELNPNSGIKVGDDIEFEGDNEFPVMKVLAPDGSAQAELWGGERIFRRAFTKLLINYVKKANANRGDPEKFESICKSIGRKMFKELHAQDNRKPEYVKAADVPKENQQ